MMIDGESITLGGTEYILPPLPLGKVFLVNKMAAGLDPMENEADAATFGDAIFYSLQRNYPDLKREFVHAQLDMLNFRATVQAFGKANGLKSKESEPGETQAAI